MIRAQRSNSRSGGHAVRIVGLALLGIGPLAVGQPGPPPGAGGGGGGGGSFNAFESSTPSDSTEGPLYTKVAGTAFQVDVVSLGGGGNLRAFNGDVELELVAADSTLACANLPLLADLKTASFSQGEKRITVSNLTYAQAAANARIRVTEVNGGGNPKQGCSNDRFSIRPHHLSVQARDADWETAGTGRRLDGTNAAACQSGGGSEACHKAGQPFTLEGQAVNGGGSAVTGFAETAFLTWSLVSPPHDGDDVLGARAPGQVTFAGDGTGFRTDSAVYREVGVVDQTLNDQGNFAEASGDPGDGHCVTGSSSNAPGDDPDGLGRYGCQTATTAPSRAGRFVPDRFQVGHADFEFGRACSGNFTYFGQAFTWVATPTVTITAVEAGGTTTANYEGPFWRLPDYLDRFEDDSNTGEAGNDGDDRALDATNVSHTWPATTDANGQITVTYAGSLVYTRTTPEAPIRDGEQVVKLRFDVGDNDGVEYEGGTNPPTYLVTPITGADPVRFGRLDVVNAHGPEIEDLGVPVRARYYTGSRFAGNTLDSCTPMGISGGSGQARLQLRDGATWVAADQTVALRQGSGGATEANSVSGLGSGQGAMTLDAPGPGNTGYVPVRVDLGDHPWLRGDWDRDGAFDDYPTARATFGRYPGNEHILYWREIFH